MSPNSSKFLKDIQEQCQWIQRAVESRSLEDYLTDTFLAPALERKLEIIGKALNQMLKAEPALESRFTDTKSIIAFRNRLIHAYFDLDPEIVWGAAVKKAPELLREVEILVKERGI